MTLDLTDDEKAGVARLHDREWPYPLSPRLATLKAILGGLEPPLPNHEPPPLLKAYDAPSASMRRRR